ncbi:MAG: V-type ATPase subunit [Candidatus Aenigmatarchaeota archaeon]|nr:MAG: V-type ATPase subunit [Candidatus Aenigmarchaeota archaeon]
MASKENEYAYAYGVVSGMTAKLIDDKTFDELARFRSVEEVVAFLEGTDYEPEIKKVVGKTIDIQNLENALKKHFVRIYNSIISSIPESDRKDLNRIISEGLRAENLKIIMRGIHSGMEPEKIEEMLDMKEDEEFMKELAKAKSIEEFIEKLGETEYHDVLKSEIPKYNELGNLLPLENSLDKHMIDSWRGISSKVLRRFVDIKIDTIHIRTILRCKISKIPSKDYVIEGGNLKNRLGEMERGEVKDILEILDRTTYGKAAKEAMAEYEKTKSLVSFEKKLESDILTFLKENAILRPLGVFSVMSFINSKRREVRNLNTVVVCKHYDIPPEEIKEILM